jgi:hypothetical protein
MTYEDIEFAGLGRNEWILLIYYPDNGTGESSVYSSADRVTTQSPQRANGLTDG